MSGHRWRRGLGLGLVAVLTGLSTVLAAPAGADTGSAGPSTGSSPSPSATGVDLTVLDQAPLTPKLSGAASALTVTLAVHNAGTQALASLSLGVVREAPISTTTDLDAELRDPQPSDPSLTVPLPSLTIPGTVAAGATTTIRYTVTVGPQDDATLGLNQDGGVYPLQFDLQAARLDDSGQSQDGIDLVASAYAYVPTFFGNHAQPPVDVGWVWPLVDRPHRATEGAVFTDDDLTAEVSSGGRLDRSLAVVERVPATVRLTLVIDPELVDELIAMSGGYRVQSAAGTGSRAASAWLRRLRQVLTRHDVSFTAVADPDLDAVRGAGLQALVHPVSDDAAMSARIEGALGLSTLPTTLDWPVDGSLSATSAAQAERQGATGFLLAGTGLVTPPRTGALTRLQGQPQGVVAAVTRPELQELVSSAVAGSTGPGAASALRTLVARLAVQGAEALQSPDQARSTYVVLTPPRWVDPDVAAAVRAITTTTSAQWSGSVSIAQARATATVAAASGLAPAGSSSLPQANLDAAGAVLTTGNDTYAMLTDGRSPAASPSTSPTAAPTPGGPSPAAVQGAASLLTAAQQTAERLVSSGWGSDPAASGRAVAAAQSRAASAADAVRIVAPSGGGYTLTSSDSPLPITLRNNLDYPAWVRLSFGLQGTLGLSITDPGVVQIPARGVLPLQLKAHVERSGRFEISATLVTPGRQPVGAPITLTVHSTALGAVGVIITSVALAVLVVALIVRVALRYRRRGRVAVATPGSDRD